MHPQYDLFKQWTMVNRPVLEAMLEDRFILFGEWLYARHSVHYRKLPHFFFEFDLCDKQTGDFLDLERRMAILKGTGIHTVPIIHRGPVTPHELPLLLRASAFDSLFENPVTGRMDGLMKGLYLRAEAGGVVTGGAKSVRAEFVEKVKQSDHWQHQAMVLNRLAEGADIWA